MGRIKGGDVTMNWWNALWNNASWEKTQALKNGTPEAEAEYNSRHPSNKITQEDKDTYEKEHNADPEAKAIKQSDYEIERSKFWDKKREEAMAKSEELLNNQPDYTIPQEVYGYAKIMGETAAALSGITPGGVPTYTYKEPSVTNYPGYSVPSPTDGSPTGGSATRPENINAFASMQQGYKKPTGPGTHRRFS